MNLIKYLIELYATFFKIGLITFGGGLTMLPILERELIENKGWTTNEELLDYYAIAQTTPGIIAVNVSTFVGHKKAGTPGAVAATLGMVSPSIIIIVLIARFISNFDSIPWVRKAMAGINVGVAALLTYSVVNLFRKTVKNIPGFCLYAVAFTSVYFFHVRTIVVILGTASLGLILYFARRKGDENREALK